MSNNHISSDMTAVERGQLLNKLYPPRHNLPEGYVQLLPWPVNARMFFTDASHWPYAEKDFPYVPYGDLLYYRSSVASNRWCWFVDYKSELVRPRLGRVIAVSKSVFAVKIDSPIWDYIVLHRPELIPPYTHEQVFRSATKLHEEEF